jgi:hypothetical protein
MPITALALILVFLLLTFIYSAYEKISDWKMSEKYYVDEYKNVFPSFFVRAIILFILFSKPLLVSLLVTGIYDLLFTTRLSYVYYALTGSAMLLLILLLGLRMLKDYEGASRIGIYFLVAITGFIVLSINFMILQKTID